MPKPDLTFSISQVTISSGKLRYIEIMVDDRRVRIPVSPEIRAYFDQQFVRRNPSKAQSQKFATIMNLLRAAYKKGQEDGR